MRWTIGFVVEIAIVIVIQFLLMCIHVHVGEREYCSACVNACACSIGIRYNKERNLCSCREVLWIFASCRVLIQELYLLAIAAALLLSPIYCWRRNLYHLIHIPALIFWGDCAHYITLSFEGFERTFKAFESPFEAFGCTFKALCWYNDSLLRTYLKLSSNSFTTAVQLVTACPIHSMSL